MSQVKLIQFSVESSHVRLKIWATWLDLSWKCEQFDSISIQVQNVNLKLNLMISLLKTQELKNIKKKSMKDKLILTNYWNQKFQNLEIQDQQFKN